jgi:hypothetical protein
MASVPQAGLVVAERSGAHIRTLKEQLGDTHCGARETKQSESESIIAIRICFSKNFHAQIQK